MALDGPVHPGSGSLSGRLTEKAAGHRSGTLRIDDFMTTALYDPAGGYYMRAETIGGQRRDFSTIPSLSPLLGQAIARWATSLPGAGRGPLDIIEVGAGGGHLAAAIWKSLGWWSRRRLCYRIVEIAPRLKQAQKEMLAGRRIHWHESVAAAVAAADRPLVISNELVDAFPCRLLRYENGAWNELRLPWPPRAGHPLQSHPREDLDLEGFSAADPDNWPGGQVPAGQIIEVHPAYRDWLGAWAADARGLNHLTIDYGDVMPRLYRDRPQGTLRGYLAHQRLTGDALFRAPGKIDLTCDVNFTDLERWGYACGLRTVEFTDQAGFLKRFLPGRMAANPGSEQAAVSDPDGAGGAFRVLWQTAE